MKHILPPHSRLQKGGRPHGGAFNSSATLIPHTNENITPDFFSMSSNSLQFVRSNHLMQGEIFLLITPYLLSVAQEVRAALRFSLISGVYSPAHRDIQDFDQDELIQYRELIEELRSSAALKEAQADSTAASEPITPGLIRISRNITLEFTPSGGGCVIHTADASPYLGAGLFFGGGLGKEKVSISGTLSFTPDSSNILDITVKGDTEFLFVYFFDGGNEPFGYFRADWAGGTAGGLGKFEFKT